MLKTYADQLADRLREGIIKGRWVGTMPGCDRLARELGANSRTVMRALTQLETNGLLINQGSGKRRLINHRQANIRPASLRVQVLLYEELDRKLDYLVELFHLLQAENHAVCFAEKTLQDLGMNVDRVARFVASSQADAWVVLGGSNEVLHWFSRQSTPAFALFGRLTKVPMASTSPKKADAFEEAVDQLVALGHRRMVYLVREERRKPTPGFLERLFLERLAARGVSTGTYNLPDWEESPAGLHLLLESLFQRTPPTAMLIDGPALFAAVRAYLGDHRLTVPGDISLICTDPDPTFAWCVPQVSHMSWDTRPLIRRVAGWVNNISRGKDDRRKSSHKARFVLGGTIGPPPPTQPSTRSKQC